MITWRILLRQIWEIENKKKQYCQANCYDAERAFFDIDTKRQGFIDLESVRINLNIIFKQFKNYIEQQQAQHPATPTGPLYGATKPDEHLNDKDIEMLYFYINRKDLTKMKLDDVRY